MTQIPAFFSKEDSLGITLPDLFESWGYKKYRMSKFEEYSFYSDNRSFLSDDGVIAFNNADGRLMALKPDITLSIVKNAKLSEKQTKLYYNESVFRMAANTRDFREIKQCGVEVLGDVDGYLTAEILMLAAESLAQIDKSYVLSVSHNALVLSLLQEWDVAESDRKALINCIGSRNAHDFRRICRTCGVAEKAAEEVAELFCIEGKINDTLPLLENRANTAKMRAALNELKSVAAALTACGLADKVHLDLSVTQHIDYYTGIVFRGYVEKAPVAVLSGGRYDKLARKIRENVGAIGFAVYLDNLNLYYRKPREYDADILVLNVGSGDPAALLTALREYTAEGQRVCVEREKPEGFRAKKTLIYLDGALREV